MKKKNQRTIAVWALVIALCATTVAYAALSTTLNISGSATRKGGTWNVSLANVHNVATTGTGSFTTQPGVSGTKLTFAASLAQPNDSISFDVDIVNSGSINAYLSDLDFCFNGSCAASFSSFETTNISQEDITCYLLDSADKVIDMNDMVSCDPDKMAKIPFGAIAANGNRKTIKVKCSYNDVNQISSTTKTMNVSVDFLYSSVKPIGC